MEFKLNIDKVIGIVDHRLGVESARIKILSIIDSAKRFTSLTEKQTIELFPPKGFVFEPGFFHNHPYSEGDIISFYIINNEQTDPDKDQFRINEKKTVKFYGVDTRRIIGFSKGRLVTNLSLVSIEKNETQSDGDFFGITDKFVVGKLRVHNGKISPALYNRITIWDIDEFEFIEYKNKRKLHRKPTGEHILIDCMDDTQLFEWFREKIKAIDATYVKLLDETTKWREEIPKYFSTSDKEMNEVDEVRFERIKEKFKYFDLSISDTKELIEKSDALRKEFILAVERHKEEWTERYEKQLEKHREDYEKQKELLDNELIDLHNSKKEMETILDSKMAEIIKLNLNKERILTDFSIIKEVLNMEFKTEKSKELPNSFIMEEIKKLDDVILFSSRDEFVSELQYHLNKFNLFPNFAKRLLNVISVYNGIFIKDIKLGLAFAEAVNNTKFIIQQVEPDWLHFRDFWNNGLGAIWQSAHKFPDIIHFLLLEDINLSSPECYARPLFDVINSIRKHIPYGKTSYPKNLKILATKASTAEPEIGLPVIEQTFTGWGAIGFNDKLYEKSDVEYKSITGFINAETLDSYQPDDSEIEDVKLAVRRDIKNLFETE